MYHRLGQDARGTQLEVPRSGPPAEVLEDFPRKFQPPGRVVCVYRFRNEFLKQAKVNSPKLGELLSSHQFSLHGLHHFNGAFARVQQVACARGDAFNLCIRRLHPRIFEVPQHTEVCDLLGW